MKVGDIVQVWDGVIIGSPYPPPPGAKYLPAKVLEIGDQHVYVAFEGRRSVLWVPWAAIRPAE